ncbi:hemolysin III family protein [uncultured Gimesia sp.]|uniref:PAQR family membrane homeostasis protein TrhA n=1 Tax=uncultured Gimesia sp. TaxID=1678688 RepID=UPI00262AAF9C|nr:hemolysin III family protein [uncultured Gimesia sp.]
MSADSNEFPTLKRAEDRPADESANLITHALGFFLSVIASAVLMMLVVQYHQTINIIACGIYCCSLTGLYAASMLSHMFYDLAWRRFFRTLDQVCIYLLIAGSYTPFAVVYLWHSWWPMLLVSMWVFAIFGVLLVLYMRNLTPMAMLTYGILGWLPIISLKTLYDATPLDIFTWIIAGGFFYSAGSVFLIFDQRVRYFHALWHTFAIAGSTCHYIALLMVML